MSNFEWPGFEDRVPYGASSEGRQLGHEWEPGTPLPNRLIEVVVVDPTSYPAEIHDAALEQVATGGDKLPHGPRTFQE